MRGKSMSGQIQSGHLSQEAIEKAFNQTYKFVAPQLATMTLEDLNRFMTAYEQAIQFPNSNIKPGYEANYATAVNRRNQLMGVAAPKETVPDKPVSPLTDEQKQRLRSVSAPAVPEMTAERNKQIQLKQLISFEQYFQFNQQQSDRLAQAIKRLDMLGGGADRQRLAPDNINMGLRAIKEVVDFIHRYEQAGVGSPIQETYKTLYEQICWVRDQRMPAVMNLVRTSLTQVETSLNESRVLAEEPSQQAKAASQLKSLMWDLIQKNMTECQQVLKTYLTASSTDLARQVESFSQHLADSAMRIETQKDAIQVKMTELQEKTQVVKSALIKLNKKLATYSDSVMVGIQNEYQLKASTLIQLENARSELVILGLLTPNFELNTSMPGYASLSTQPKPEKIVNNLHEIMFKLKHPSSEQDELKQELQALLPDLKELIDSYTAEEVKHILMNPQALKEELDRLHAYQNYCVEYGLLTESLQEDKSIQSVSFYQTVLEQAKIDISPVLTALNQITEKFASSLAAFEAKEKQLNAVGKPIDNAETIAAFREENTRAQRANRLRSVSAPTPLEGVAAIKAFKVSQQSAKLQVATASAPAQADPKVVSAATQARPVLQESPSEPNLGATPVDRSELKRSHSTSDLPRKVQLTAYAPKSPILQDLEKSTPKLAKFLQRMASAVGLLSPTVAPKTVTILNIPPQQKGTPVANAVVGDIRQQHELSYKADIQKVVEAVQTISDAYRLLPSARQGQQQSVHRLATDAHGKAYAAIEAAQVTLQQLLPKLPKDTAAYKAVSELADSRKLPSSRDFGNQIVTATKAVNSLAEAAGVDISKPVASTAAPVVPLMRVGR